MTATIIGSIAFADVELWNKSERRDGNFRVESGTMIQVEGEKEKNTVVNSIDPISGNVDITLSQLFWDDTANIRTISTVIDEKKLDFKFRIQPDLDEKLLFNLPGQGYYLVHIPDSYQYILEYSDNLFFIDSQTSEVYPLLKNQLGNYDIKDLENETIEGTVPQWGFDPHVSPDGKILVFRSTRSMLDGNMNGEMWVKYLPNEEEYAFMNIGVNLLSFSSDDVVYYELENRIERVNLRTKQTEVVVDLSVSAGISGDYMLYQPEYDQLKKIKLEDKAEQPINIKEIGRTHNFWTHANNPWIIIESQPDRKEEMRQLILYNVNTDEHRKIIIPSDKTLISVSWLNADQFIVSYAILGKDQEETYIINIEDVR